MNQCTFLPSRWNEEGEAIYRPRRTPLPISDRTATTTHCIEPSSCSAFSIFISFRYIYIARFTVLWFSLVSIVCGSTDGAKDDQVLLVRISCSTGRPKTCLSMLKLRVCTFSRDAVKSIGIYLLCWDGYVPGTHYSIFMCWVDGFCGRSGLWWWSRAFAFCFPNYSGQPRP